MMIWTRFSPGRHDRESESLLSAQAKLPSCISPPARAAWWADAPRLAARSSRARGEIKRASYRLGAAMLEVESTYQPLLDDLHHAYGDCAVAASAGDLVPRVRCFANLIQEQSLLVLRFSAPEGLPHLCDVAMCLTRPRAELQHYSIRELDQPGWRLIANALDESAPLLAAGENFALLDVRVQPPELLLNLVVGLAQLVQQSVIFIHAGGVSINGQGTLLIGRSGRGKSTTSVALASRGHGLLGDETVGIRADSCEIVAFRRTLKLRPGPGTRAIAERLSAVPHTLRSDANGVMCAWVGAGALFPGSTPVLSAPLRNAFFLRDFRAQPVIESFIPDLARLEELRALTMSLSAVVSWPVSPARRLMRFAQVIDLLARCRCHFLDLGSPDETAALIERTVLNHAA